MNKQYCLVPWSLATRLTWERGVRLGLLAAFLFLLQACSTPLPPEKTDYAGEWQGAGMYLLVTSDGRVEYRRVKGAATTENSGPIKEFVGDDFIVGVAFFTTTFQVQQPPQEVNGSWQMVVDEVLLTRVQGPGD